MPTPDAVESGVVEDFVLEGGYPSSRLRHVVVAPEPRIVRVAGERRIAVVRAERRIVPVVAR